MTHLEKVRELRARTDIHFNCCQSVLVTFAREMGLTEQQAFDLGANFGSGMRCGSACGALTGGLMVLGMTNCPPERADAFRNEFRAATGTLTVPPSSKPPMTPASPARSTAMAWSSRW